MERQNILFDEIDGMKRIVEQRLDKDFSTLRGFLDYVETISTEDIKIEIQDSMKGNVAVSVSPKFTNIGLTDLMKHERLAKSSHRYITVPETQDLCSQESADVNWKLNNEDPSLYRCAICQVQFSNRVSLDRHIVDLHLGTTGHFTCDICDKEFSRISDLARHKLIHTGVKPFQCNTCEKQFSRQDHLKQHILSHSQCSDSELFAFENGLNRCTICHKQLSRAQHLRTHMRQHLGTLFECDKCSKRFSRASHLRAHMRLHLGTCFRCDICKKEFSRPSDLDRHKITHSDKKLFECPTCKKKFSRKDNLKKHMLSHIESIPPSQDNRPKICFDVNISEDSVCIGSDKNCQCNICVAKHNSFPSVFQGRTIIHSDIKCHECHICKKCFNRKDHLKRHLASHKISIIGDQTDAVKKTTDEFLFNINSDSFELRGKSISYDVYKVEMNGKFHFNKDNVCTHVSPEKKFECAICEKRFNRKVRLKEHVRVHENGNFDSNDGNEDENRCNICQKQLSRPEHLKAHMRLHLGTLFKCDVCEKEFSRLSDLDRHKLVHSGVKQFLCIICHRQFSRKDYLKNHMLSHANQKSFECDKCKKRFTYFTNLRNHLHLHTLENKLQFHE